MFGFEENSILEAVDLHDLMLSSNATVSMIDYAISFALMPWLLLGCY